jgi:hypothetical protein
MKIRGQWRLVLVHKSKLVLKKVEQTLKRYSCLLITSPAVQSPAAEQWQGLHCTRHRLIRTLGRLISCAVLPPIDRTQTPEWRFNLKEQRSWAAQVNIG